jgi:hypothetical protein
MKYPLGQSLRGATRIGFTDIVIIAIVAAVLLFAAWKQFPAYDRPFKPRRILTPSSRVPVPKSIHTPAPHAPAPSQSQP